MQGTKAIYISDESNKVAQEPELRTIVDSLRDVVERLEVRGTELMAFEAKVSANGLTPTPTVDTDHAPISDNYPTELRNILGRLRAMDEEKFTPAVNMLRAFL